MLQIIIMNCKQQSGLCFLIFFAISILVSSTKQFAVNRNKLKYFIVPGYYGTVENENQNQNNNNNYNQYINMDDVYIDQNGYNEEQNIDFYQTSTSTFTTRITTTSMPLYLINNNAKLKSINKHLNEEYYDDPIIEYMDNLLNKKKPKISKSKSKITRNLLFIFYCSS